MLSPAQLKPGPLCRQPRLTGWLSQQPTLLINNQPQLEKTKLSYKTANLQQHQIFTITSQIPRAEAEPPPRTPSPHKTRVFAATLSSTVSRAPCSHMLLWAYHIG